MPAPKVLIVDDQPINIQLLKRGLERRGIETASARNGKECLESVKREKPDLILLDLMMPDMDGIEVCQQLQADEGSRSIPVIFITAKTTKESKLEGLSVGAVDYITKPVDLDEMVARVQTQLRFVAINREMVELQRRLGQARHAASIGAVTHGIAHNLNNLLAIVMGHLDLIKTCADKPEQVRKNVQRIEEASSRIVAIVRQISSITVTTPRMFIDVSIQSMIENSISRFHGDNHLNAPVSIDNPLGNRIVSTNIEVFEDALSKIVTNAWESYDNDPAEPRPISIHTRLVDQPDRGSMLEIRVDDQGRGIDPEIRDHMFDPFISTKNTVGVGMGLTVARHGFRTLGGDITLGDRPGGGTSAVLVHPVQPPSTGSGQAAPGS
jgi:CheY-like chemotaxis protein